MSTAIQTLTLMPAPAPAAIHNYAHQDDAFWQAVVERNAQMDGILYYGVKSTGIYCRPACPSRRPRREVVDFFASPEAAERAGLRACLRCKPREQGSADPHAEQTKTVCDYIERNLDGTITLKTIADAVGGSPFHIQRVFKQTLGISPHEYAEARRVAVFKAALRFGQSVAEATYEAGFNSSSRIYERAHGHLGMTPSAYQKGAPAKRITYTIAASPLGRLLVAATEKGICKVAIGDKDADLSTELYAEFPKALIARAADQLSQAVEKIVEYLEGKTKSIPLPTDVRATAFQIRVWQELRKIPLGQTRTYEQIAHQMRRPRAIRAVANACANNPVALIVPCHRVVRKDGSMGGYRWGIARKERLLKQESTMAQKKT